MAVYIVECLAYVVVKESDRVVPSSFDAFEGGVSGFVRSKTVAAGVEYRGVYSVFNE